MVKIVQSVMVWDKYLDSKMSLLEYIESVNAAHLIIAAFILAVGYGIGSLRKDKWWTEMLHSQQNRGDYWFDKYQAIVRDGNFVLLRPDLADDSEWEDDEDHEDWC